MITTEEATRLVMEHRLPLQTIAVPLEKATGSILQETLRADRDFPPFHRVMMDGIAYRLQDITENETLIVDGLQHAGEPPQTILLPGHCLEVMTGAVLPGNADTVTRYEDLVFSEEEGRKMVRLTVKPEKKGQYVHHQGSDQRAGVALLHPGAVIGPAEIAVAASVGKTHLQVSQPPVVGIVSTGDELVEVHETPQPYQIRKSNGYALQSALAAMHIPAALHHLPDTKEAVRQGLDKAFAQHDVLIVSGGVSKGKRDYVPEVLEETGIRKIFHQVRQRPGKPFWFGTQDRKTVFALPGNPVSTFLCFYRYVAPWLRAVLGNPDASPPYAILSEEVVFEPDLTYFLQVNVQFTSEGQLTAQPSAGHGSGDFANLLTCNGFLELPADKTIFRQGDCYPFIAFRHL